MDENELVKSAKRGDQLALAKLFQNNYTFLMKFLLKISMNKDLAEELTQETFTKSIEKLHLYNFQSKFSTWLISMATNLYIDNRRKKKRERNWKLEKEQDIRKLKWQIENQNEEWNDCLDILSTLKEEHRTAIILKHYYGYSYDEIGEMLHVSPGTIKSRIHHGILQIRKELDISEEKTRSSAK